MDVTLIPFGRDQAVGLVRSEAGTARILKAAGAPRDLNAGVTLPAWNVAVYDLALRAPETVDAASLPRPSRVVRGAQLLVFDSHLRLADSAPLLFREVGLRARPSKLLALHGRMVRWWSWLGRDLPAPGQLLVRADEGCTLVVPWDTAAAVKVRQAADLVLSGAVGTGGGVAMRLGIPEMRAVFTAWPILAATPGAKDLGAGVVWVPAGSVSGGLGVTGSLTVRADGVGVRGSGVHAQEQWEARTDLRTFGVQA